MNEAKGKDKVFHVRWEGKSTKTFKLIEENCLYTPVRTSFKQSSIWL